MDAVNKIKRMVGAILTKMRGTMKQKVRGSTITNTLYSCAQLTKSICMGMNVVRLTKNLVPLHGFVFTAAHWNRVVFLVCIPSQDVMLGTNHSSMPA